MHYTELIDKLVRELSYRVGIPNVHDREHQSIMSEILTEWGEFESKETIFNFLNEAPDDDKYSSVGYGYFVRKGDEEKEDAQKYKKDDGGNYVPVSPDQYQKDKQKQGDAGKKAAANTPQNKQGGGEEGGDEQGELPIQGTTGATGAAGGFGAPRSRPGLLGGIGLQLPGFQYVAYQPKDYMQQLDRIILESLPIESQTRNRSLFGDFIS